jgi:exodeoxyribonuclease-3
MISTTIATFNVNGITSRFSALLDWLAKEAPDIVCLQELKAPDNRFPAKALRDAGYGALWHGQASWNGVAILAKGAEPKLLQRGLPGDAADLHSRYLEAEIGGLVVGCLYLPNGNPQPGPKFDYKLAWFERFNSHAKKLLASGRDVILAGDYNVVPTDFDIYNPKSWKKDALLQPAPRAAYTRLLAQGWTDALRARHPEEQIFTFWDYFRNHWERNSGLRIDHLLLSKSLAPRLVDANVHRWVRAMPHASDHAPTWVQIAQGVQPKGRAKKVSPPRAAAASRRAPKAAPQRLAPRKRKRA